MSSPFDSEKLETANDVIDALAHHAKLAIVYINLLPKLPEMLSGQGSDNFKKLAYWASRLVDEAGILDVPLGNEMLSERIALAHLEDGLVPVYRLRAEGANATDTRRILEEKFGHLLSGADIDKLNISAERIAKPGKNSGNQGGPKDAARLMAGEVLEMGSGATVKRRLEELHRAKPVTDEDFAAYRESYERFIEEFDGLLRKNMKLEP